MNKGENMEIKMKYKDIGAFEFSSLIQKLAQTPTETKKAERICGIVRQIQNARNRIADGYKKDVMEVFGQKNEDGSLKRPENEPSGFVPDESRMEDLNKATEQFGEKEMAFECLPLTSSTLSDIKMSAKEIELLKDIYSKDSGPGVPEHFEHALPLHSV